MSVRIVPKTLVGDIELAIVSQRIAAPEHACDNGACKSWSNPNVVNYLYVVFARVADAQVPIGILYADGPLHSTVPSWWLDSQYRGKGLGSQAMDAFAEVLKARGVTGLGAIPIDTFAGKQNKGSDTFVSKQEKRRRSGLKSRYGGSVLNLALPSGSQKGWDCSPWRDLLM